MANTLRIIGGNWRGRRIRFPGEGGIRPTPDRVRETLFNWLMTRVQGSRCLDLFAEQVIRGDALTCRRRDALRASAAPRRSPLSVASPCETASPR